MSKFPKAKRFPTETESQVPGPGTYNPTLHDPLNDPWRKGPLEIFKAPRYQEHDPGPDTFGLYNPNLSPNNVCSSRTRPRAISTLATPSKHHKELLRLETKLFERESSITNLTETLQKSEQTLKEIRKSFQKSQAENDHLHKEVDRLKKQIQGVAGLHTKLIELQTEHEKSKTRRENEISNLKKELRAAEDRASEYLDQKSQIQHSFESLQKSTQATYHTLHSHSHQALQQLNQYSQELSTKLINCTRELRLTNNLSQLKDIYSQKFLAGRASQVNEMILLLEESNLREESLDDMIDDLVDTNDILLEQFLQDQNLSFTEHERHSNEVIGFQNDLGFLQKQLEDLTRQTDIKLELCRQEIVQGRTELEGAWLLNSSLENALTTSSTAYADLSSQCRLKCNEVEKALEDLTTRDATIAQLTDSNQGLQAEIITLKNDIEDIKQNHASDRETWQSKQTELKSSLKKTEQQLNEEKEKRSKVNTELIMTRQAEAALYGQAEHAQNLQLQLEEIQGETEKLRKINDLLMRQANLNAEEAEKIAKLNIELVSQHNPAQRVKVLDRMRRELREEKENTAKLQNELWSAQSEIKVLQNELSAYQSISHPTSIAVPNSKTIPGMSRVARVPLKEAAIGSLTNTQIIKGNSPQTSPQPPTVNDESVVTNKKADFQKPPITKPHISKIPRHGQLNRKVDVVPTMLHENDTDMSIGAIKMQGKMTLEELM
ncbi:hypothetical protein O181_022866 [Austropuccinia psidii MF-1]|uniref:Uncharacterized protein n=1 Tax=Austropuccinia psidii MF-1 TaxID=1389203 RepID=A0A9Q3CDR6_9BASI|nr:hypothetical protein [Austropuccinia psidii MF-1]